ncbi:BppU family phage baseplate upper protein [Lactococcus garvieae]|uniref:BppU family phage baseplate upper protein n=1 Tax=Lactococcus garvieae TaxID=1363 RepID=UPI003D16C7ED
MQERLKLDLYQKTSISQGITTRVNDGGQHEIQATALAYGDVFDLTGWKIKFELTTSAKTISIDAVNAKITAAKEGEFSYTIPKEITGAAGNAERAYFAFEKDDKRITSADINMTILQIVDITAEEARSYIAEYNKLVEELNSITEKYIVDTDAKFGDINDEIAALNTKIEQYNQNVKDTEVMAIERINDISSNAITSVENSAKDATIKIETSSNAAIKAVDDALKKFEAGNFYTKSETDTKFKVFNDLIVSQDILAGANLDDYKKEGEFSKKTPTVVTGAPEGVTGAFRLSVRAMVGSSGIFQTLYDYATRAIYYRVGNTSLGFNLPWQRISNNSEVVHLTGDETIEGTKDFTGELKTSGNSVYGVTINSGWYEEQLGDNFYRWTQVFIVTTAINQGAGSALQQSGTLTIPTPPTNISITSRFVQAGQAPWSCWAMYFPAANAFRLFSFAARESGEVTIEAVLYGSKS